MYPEQRLLVIVENLSVEFFVLIISAIVWMLCPQRGSGVKRFRSFRLLLVFLFFTICILGAVIRILRISGLAVCGGFSVVCFLIDFLCNYSGIFRIFLWSISVGVVDLNRHE